MPRQATRIDPRSKRPISFVPGPSGFTSGADVAKSNAFELPDYSTEELEALYQKITAEKFEFSDGKKLQFNLVAPKSFIESAVVSGDLKVLMAIVSSKGTSSVLAVKNLVSVAVENKQAEVLYYLMTLNHNIFYHDVRLRQTNGGEVGGGDSYYYDLESPIEIAGKNLDLECIKTLCLTEDIGRSSMPWKLLNTLKLICLHKTDDLSLKQEVISFFCNYLRGIHGNDCLKTLVDADRPLNDRREGEHQLRASKFLIAPMIEGLLPKDEYQALLILCQGGLKDIRAFSEVPAESASINGQFTNLPRIAASYGATGCLQVMGLFGNEINRQVTCLQVCATDIPQAMWLPIFWPFLLLLGPCLCQSALTNSGSPAGAASSHHHLDTAEFIREFSAESSRPDFSDFSARHRFIVGWNARHTEAGISLDLEESGAAAVSNLSAF